MRRGFAPEVEHMESISIAFPEAAYIKIVGNTFPEVVHIMPRGSGRKVQRVAGT